MNLFNFGSFTLVLNFLWWLPYAWADVGSNHSYHAELAVACVAAAFAALKTHVYDGAKPKHCIH